MSKRYYVVGYNNEGAWAVIDGFHADLQAACSSARNWARTNPGRGVFICEAIRGFRGDISVDELSPDLS